MWAEGLIFLQRYALESGVTTINGKIAKPDTVVRNGDRIENIVHRHEPPVASKPVKILLEDREREFIVIDKPGSIVRIQCRLELCLVDLTRFENSLFMLQGVIFISRSSKSCSGNLGTRRLTVRTISWWLLLGHYRVLTWILAVNRLDRLTSGLMIIGLSSPRAHTLSQEFVQGKIKKEYIARCSGEFPAEEVVVDQPLLTVDRQMGLNIVHPEGKVRISRPLEHVDQMPTCLLPSRQKLSSDGCTMTEAPTRAYFTVRNYRLRMQGKPTQ
jgi:hypothetical protein